MIACASCRTVVAGPRGTGTLAQRGHACASRLHKSPCILHPCNHAFGPLSARSERCAPRNSLFRLCSMTATSAPRGRPRLGRRHPASAGSHPAAGAVAHLSGHAAVRRSSNAKAGARLPPRCAHSGEAKKAAGPGGHRGRAAERGDAEAREPWRGKGRGVARCLPEVTMGNKCSPLAKVHSYGTQDGELAGSADVHQQWQALGRGLQGLSLGEHVAADRAR